MFWSANFISAREVNLLLKEENVTLTQLLDADDILQECKAENKALMAFLVRPEVLAELISLLTEEPAAEEAGAGAGAGAEGGGAASRYRAGFVASELVGCGGAGAALAERVSSEPRLLRRLCDFVRRAPPLNPLLASFFSKAVQMLFERHPNQDWYSHHIVCLRVLDYLQERRDFLPSVLRHMGTSAIADVCRHLVRLHTSFSPQLLQWFEEHDFLNNLIHLICGTYVYPVGEGDEVGGSEVGGGEVGGGEVEEVARRRLAAVQSSNAANLLCDIILTSCCDDACPREGCAVVGAAVGRQVAREAWTGALLRHACTAPQHARAHALCNAADVLLALLHQAQAEGAEGGVAEGGVGGGAGQEGEEAGGAAGGVESALAPHLPLLHHELLHEPAPGVVGRVRVQMCRVVAQLARSRHHDVAAALQALGSVGSMVGLVEQYPRNSVAHAQVVAAVTHALYNPLYHQQYAHHLLTECDLLTRLMDMFAVSDTRAVATQLCRVVRARSRGHPPPLLAGLPPPPTAQGEEGEAGVLPALRVHEVGAAVAERWEQFCAERLDPLLDKLDTPLGGVYPSDKIYEEDSLQCIGEYDVNEPPAGYAFESGAHLGGGGGGGGAGSVEAMDEDPDDDDDVNEYAKQQFLHLNNKFFDDKAWGGTDDSGEVEPGAHTLDPSDILSAANPWECLEGGGGGEEDEEEGEGGWAQWGGGCGAGGEDAADDYDTFMDFTGDAATYKHASHAGVDVGSLSQFEVGKLPRGAELGSFLKLSAELLASRDHLHMMRDLNVNPELNAETASPAAHAYLPPAHLADPFLPISSKQADAEDKASSVSSGAEGAAPDVELGQPSTDAAPSHPLLDTPNNNVQETGDALDNLSKCLEKTNLKDDNGEPTSTVTEITDSAAKFLSPDNVVQINIEATESSPQKKEIDCSEPIDKLNDSVARPTETADKPTKIMKEFSEEDDTFSEAMDHLVDEASSAGNDASNKIEEKCHKSDVKSDER